MRNEVRIQTEKNKRYNRELLHANTELEQQKVALEEALTALARESEYKSEFLANMSHEIRTPINGMVGMLNLLLKTNPTDKQLNYTEKALSSADILLRVVNDILDFSKIAAGKLDIEQTAYSPRTIIENTIESLRVLAGPKNLDLNFDIKEIPDILVSGDSARLQQILYNLINNAIKFTEEGSIDVYVALEKKSESGNQTGGISAGDSLVLRCSVSDTGIGMSQAVLDRLFQSFTQADSSTSRRYGGTGLGLTIAKQLSQLMGGDISATSKAGRGSVFSFEINVVARGDVLPHGSLEPQIPQRETKLSENVSDDIGTAARPKLAGFVLLVEDNAINQFLAKELLDEFGVSVKVVGNGLQALSYLNTHPHDAKVDCIFMDCQMPEMDGYEATQAIRRCEAGSRHIHTPIIAMTALSMQGDKDKCLAAGMSDYITKPIDESLFYEKLHMWLNQ